MSDVRPESGITVGGWGSNHLRFGSRLRVTEKLGVKRVTFLCVSVKHHSHCPWFCYCLGKGGDVVTPCPVTRV